MLPLSDLIKLLLRYRVHTDRQSVWDQGPLGFIGEGFPGARGRLPDRDVEPVRTRQGQTRDLLARRATAARSRDTSTSYQKAQRPLNSWSWAPEGVWRGGQARSNSSATRRGVARRAFVRRCVADGEASGDADSLGAGDGAETQTDGDTRALRRWSRGFGYGLGDGLGDGPR